MYMQFTVDKSTLHFLICKFMVFKYDSLFCLKGSNTFLEVYGRQFIFFRASSLCHINSVLSFYQGINQWLLIDNDYYGRERKKEKRKKVQRDEGNLCINARCNFSVTHTSMPLIYKWFCVHQKEFSDVKDIPTSKTCWSIPKKDHSWSVVQRCRC